MTAIGKLMATLLLAISLGMMTWAVSTYVQRPGWFAPVPEGGIDKGSTPVSFAQLKDENEAFSRSAAVASDTWGANLKELEDREKFRNDRLKAYADRNKWARTGNPKHLVNPADLKSGVGFYAPTLNPALKLYDLNLDPATGLPKGEAIRGSDDQPLPGVDQQAGLVAENLIVIQRAAAKILELRDKIDAESVKVRATQAELLGMNVIRDSIRNELFYLDRLKGNVSETGETVFRRQKQLLTRLKALGVTDP